MDPEVDTERERKVSADGGIVVKFIEPVVAYLQGEAPLNPFI